MYRDRNQRNFARELRNNSTPAEQRLWWHLKSDKLGVKFRRQAAIGRYVVDFVCFSKKLIIELDGPQHLTPEAVEYDESRTNWLASEGFHTIRFRNQEVDDGIQGIVDQIKRVLDGLEPTKNPSSPALPTEGREPNPE